MGKSREKGQISIFLSTVLLAVIVVAGILVDAARISAGEAQVKRAVSCAARSVLAGYGSRLKDEYGIFAFTTEDENKLSELIKTYVEKNLMAEDSEEHDKGTVDMYGFRVESINVTPLFNLTENETVRAQILEYMKYRAPKEALEFIWSKLNLANKAGKMSEAYRKKIKVDALLGKIDTLQKKLKISIDGTCGDGKIADFYINKFNQDGSFERLVESYGEYAEEYVNYKEIMEEHASNIQNLEDRIRNENDPIKISEMEKEADEERSKKTAASNKMNDAKRELADIEKRLRQDEVKSLIEPNKHASRDIKSMMELGIKARAALKELEEYMDANFKAENGISGEFENTCNSDINKLKELILEGEKAEALLDAVDTNLDVLEDIIGELDNIHKTIFTGGLSISKEDITDPLTEGLTRYSNSLKYDYDALEKDKSAEDPRKTIAEKAAEKLKEIISEDINIEKSGIPMEELPSRKKVISRDFGAEDSIYIDMKKEAENPTVVLSEEPQDMRDELKELDKKVDFTDDGEFASDALSFVSSLGSRITGTLEDVRDEIYINEYIMGVFKNSVPELKGEANKNTRYDLRGFVKKNRDTFFNSEVEYILHGNSSEQVNKLMTRGQLLLIRFGLNTLHVYTDPQKKELAYSAASMLAGLWTGGAGIPIIANLIMCSWGMGEAIVDITDLMDGKSVPFYKTKGDWKLDIGIGKEEISSVDPGLSFTYYDYLRLFLLLKSPDEKISRIEDLIELNLSKTDSGFKMSGCNTFIRVEAVVSMKYLFLSKPVMPWNWNEEKGRHEFKVLIYEGY